MSVLRILRAGLLTTVQDQGRLDLRHFGVPVGGAMDQWSHELANRLVGNSPSSATLEMTLTGDEIEWSHDALIAITGADMNPVLNSSLRDGLAVPQHRPVFIPAGTRIRFSTARRGCRCYVAVAGGLDVPVVMGSRSTYLRAALGGFHGRALRAGDEIPTAQVTPSLPLVTRSPAGSTERSSETSSSESPHAPVYAPFYAPAWFVRPLDLPDTSDATLRILPGAHFECLTPDSQSMALTSAFRISPQSDRMGYRLSDQSLKLFSPVEMLSEGTAVGTLQLPPDGNPILLMADSAPTGGYPRIAQLISADLSLAAQLRPGQRVRFEMTDLDTAHRILKQQRQQFERALFMSRLQSDPTAMIARRVDL